LASPVIKARPAMRIIHIVSRCLSSRNFIVLLP
jgi:hypothetical protein